MPCYHPLTAYYSAEVNESGKRSVVFQKSDALFHGEALRPLSIPCGQCIGCRLEKSRQWAIRCVHEASLYDENCFITLTFRDNLPPNNNESDSDWWLRRRGSLVKSDFQKFMKRLRKHFGPGIRYFHCGEYGSKLERPHHHACLFNFDFHDKYLWSIRDNVRLFRSETLERLWPYGYCTIGEVTFESAAYVARYCVKKVSGSGVHAVGARSWYKGREAEYSTMSRRPGIGSAWFEKYKSEVYPADNIVINGHVVKVPDYYEKIYDLTDSEFIGMINLKKKIKAITSADNTADRLKVREEHQLIVAELLKRGVEDGA